MAADALIDAIRPAPVVAAMVPDKDDAVVETIVAERDARDRRRRRGGRRRGARGRHRCCSRISRSGAGWRTCRAHRSILPASPGDWRARGRGSTIRAPPTGCPRWRWRMRCPTTWSAGVPAGRARGARRRSVPVGRRDRPHLRDQFAGAGCAGLIGLHRGTRAVRVTRRSCRGSGRSRSRSWGWTTGGRPR